MKWINGIGEMEFGSGRKRVRQQKRSHATATMVFWTCPMLQAAEVGDGLLSLCRRRTMKANTKLADVVLADTRCTVLVVVVVAAAADAVAADDDDDDDVRCCYTGSVMFTHVCDVIAE